MAMKPTAKISQHDAGGQIADRGADAADQDGQRRHPGHHGQRGGRGDDQEGDAQSRPSAFVLRCSVEPGGWPGDGALELGAPGEVVGDIVVPSGVWRGSAGWGGESMRSTETESVSIKDDGGSTRLSSPFARSDVAAAGTQKMEEASRRLIATAAG